MWYFFPTFIVERRVEILLVDDLVNAAMEAHKSGETVSLTQVTYMSSTVKPVLRGHIWDKEKVVF
jgi:hypothetical protein